MKAANSFNFTNLSFKEIVNFYSTLRQLTYEEMNETFIGFYSTPISLQKAKIADSWTNINYKESRAEWSWVRAHQIYNVKSHFKRFDLAVSHGSNLVGLAYGIPNQSKSNLRINLIESTPIKPHRSSIRVFELISEAAQIYADLLGADEIRIMKPINNKVANYYASFGYEVVEPCSKKMPVYCCMKLRD